jgi:copper resistance protein C
MKVIRSAIVLLLVVASALSTSVGASAHADLESTSPSAGETVEAGRITLALKFAEDLMTGEANGNVISVQGPAGPDNAQWADGCLDSVNGGLMMESIAPSRPGDYVVNWRAVSADGHAVEGSYEFTVVNTTGFENEPPAACEGSQISTLGSGEEELLPVTTKAADQQRPWGISPEDGLIGGIVVITIVSVIGAFLLRAQERKREAVEAEARARRSKGDED